ncbi:MAG: hypothetical protein U5J82_12650 [Desulfobacterales bacterium]|nr:hypothetical protein [Desulfobacterales bacterium]
MVPAGGGHPLRNPAFLNRHIYIIFTPPLTAKYLNDIQKVGLKKVQQVLRHRRQTTTEIYVEGNYTDTKEAIQLLEMEKLAKSP